MLGEATGWTGLVFNILQGEKKKRRVDFWTDSCSLDQEEGKTKQMSSGCSLAKKVLVCRRLSNNKLQCSGILNVLVDGN